MNLADFVVFGGFRRIELGRVFVVCCEFLIVEEKDELSPNSPAMFPIEKNCTLDTHSPKSYLY